MTEIDLEQLKINLDYLKAAIQEFSTEPLSYIADKAFCVILESSPLRLGDGGYIWEKAEKILVELNPQIEIIAPNKTHLKFNISIEKTTGTMGIKCVQCKKSETFEQNENMDSFSFMEEHSTC